MSAAAAAAQDVSGASPAAQSSVVTISAGYELHRDRLRYEFENPSSFDTPFPVPHRFAQTYVADNQWFVCAARYPLFGDVMETEVGFAPGKATFASDFDTFSDPNGDVVVSGTDGAVSMHALRVAH